MTVDLYTTTTLLSQSLYQDELCLRLVLDLAVDAEGNSVRVGAFLGLSRCEGDRGVARAVYCVEPS